MRVVLAVLFGITRAFRFNWCCSVCIDVTQPVRPEAVLTPGYASPGGFGTLLRGDLDTIVLKALERDLKRRYDSVETLAADLRHHLEGRPISARPASLTRRLSRFIARNS